MTAIKGWMSAHMWVVTVAVGVLAFGLGNLASLPLRSDLAEVERERDAETERAADLARQLQDQDQEISALDKQLAERKKPGPANPSSSGATKGLIEIGESHSLGVMSITPTGFSKITDNGETSIYQVTVSVKNNGSEGINPFCGDEGGLVDTSGRTFAPDSDLIDGSSNCGDDVQPGLTQDNYKLDFTLPTDAKPAILQLWGEFDYEDSPKLWNVRGL